MPSNRKRIGYLPSEEIHDIIEKMCIDNKFSQSKVTGILVEEALKSRGILKGSLIYLKRNEKNKFNNSKNHEDLNMNFDLSNNFDFSTKNKKNLKEDIKMINEYIEFKLFKKVMNQNSTIFD